MKYLIILSLLLTGCGLTIPNVEVCADEGRFGAYCKYTRSERERELNKAQWDALRAQGWFCMSPPAYGAYQKFVEQACNQNKSCSDQVEQNVKEFQRDLKNHR